MEINNMPSWLSLSAITAAIGGVGIASFFTMIVGWLASRALFGIPVGQIVVSLLQTALAIFTAFVTMIFDLLKTAQGRWVLFFAAVICTLLFAWYRIDSQAYGRGYAGGRLAGIALERKALQGHNTCPAAPAPAKCKR
jgi:hypothetical protein